jgi:hypothetical protein
VLALGVVVLAAGIGISAPGGSQTVTIAAGAAIDITLASGAAAIASTNPGVCGTTATSVTIRSNRPWNLQVRSEPLTYPNGRAKDGTGVEMTNAFQFRGGDVAAYTAITPVYRNLFGVNQGRTGNRSLAIDYQQCVDYMDAPGTYTIVIEYLGVQP